MAEDHSKYKTEFKEKAEGLAIGDRNIIYNYFYREEVKATPVDATHDHLSCPYRGLFHFGPNDAKYFFGREVFVKELYEATQTRNFVPVFGASGSGKSSVVLAGLVPKLVQEGNWKFTHFRPGSDPFHALALALVPLYTPDLDETDQIAQTRKLAGYLENNTVSLSDVFAKIQQNNLNHRILLIADQFEEIYTQCSDLKVRRRFLDCLLSSFQPSSSGASSSAVLVTTMRADFLGKALAYRPLANVLNYDIKLPAMEPEELSEVIVKPAAILEVEFEAGLADRILEDVENEPGNLALLEFALTELWRGRTGNKLTHQAYEKIGKVEGALAKYAEQKYQKLKKNEQEQARQIFIQLVNLGEDNNDTRRRIYREQIGDNNWDLVTRKHGLADSRLVVTSRSSNERETLEIVHEALIRHWSRLKGWLNEDRENLNKQRQIEDAAQEWKTSGEKTDYLLSRKRLKSAKDFQKKQQEKYTLSELAICFIANSIKYRKNERLKSWGLFLIIPLIGTIIGGYFIVRELQLNTDNRLIIDCTGQSYCSGRIEALERLVQAKRSLLGYNLSDADLKSVNLSGAELISADLSDANLMYANLSSADLSGADLSGALLEGADLENANLFSADLRSALLYSVNLRNVVLYNADLRKASFLGADLSGADLRSTGLIGTSLSSAYLSGADLSGAHLSDADLESAIL